MMEETLDFKTGIDPDIAPKGDGFGEGQRPESGSISSIDRNSDIPYIRIAVSNVVISINNELIGILSKSQSADGVKSLGLIGGGAYLGDEETLRKKGAPYLEDLGKEQDLLRKKGAFHFEGSDARFKIPLNNLMKFVSIYNKKVHFSYEKSVLREVIEELSKEKIHDQETAILSDQDLDLLYETHLGQFFHYEKDEKGDVIRGTNFRIINVFSLECEDATLAKIKESSIIRTITDEMLETGEVSEDIKLKSFIKPTLEYIHSLYNPTE